MSFISIRQSLKLPVILLTMWALLFGFFCTGMFHKNTMPMEGMGNTSAVVAIAGEQHCCGSTMSQHMESWKNTFLAAPQLIRGNLILSLLGLLLTSVFIRLTTRFALADQQTLNYRFYIRDNPNLALFSHLRLAFARGILNPKIY